MCPWQARPSYEMKGVNMRKYSLDELVAVADDLKMTVDQVARVGRRFETIELNEQRSRRSTPEFNQQIDNWLASLDGQLSVDLPAREIVAKAGVPYNQGTAGHARRERDRLMLSYKS